MTSNNAPPSNSLPSNNAPVEQLAEKVKAKYEVAYTAMVDVWTKEALPASSGKKRKCEREHFLELRESSPQAEAVGPGEEAASEDLFSFLCKLVLYAPEEWYEILTHKKRPEEIKNDFKHIGVAFDASSRLRRAGIDFYHWKLTEQLQKERKLCFYLKAGDSSDVDAELMARGALEQNKPKQTGMCRLVAISDTHHFHEHLTLPPGDILVHAGDLCYEESRSADGRKFDNYKASGGVLSGRSFLRWFESSRLDLQDSLRWLQSRMGFQHKVLVGGNHDYVLEQLGPENAVALCQHYGVTYLHTARSVAKLPLKSGGFLNFWGSGVSFIAGISATRAVKSGNNAFQISEGEGQKFVEPLKRMKDEDVDVMVVHSPPQGILLSKASQSDPLGELVRAVQPKLYVCGHAHRQTDPQKGLQDMIDKTLCVNAACLGVWNQLHGYPVVVDVPINQSGSTSGCMEVLQPVADCLAGLRAKAEV